MATVLVVEDNPANMKLATMLLHGAGHAVLGAVDAESALRLARGERPDLILMDIQLPGMDGLAATAILKHDPATATIPVIALSALAMKADEERSQAAGCDAYIVKPPRYKELYAVIRRLLVEPGPVPDDVHCPGHRSSIGDRCVWPSVVEAVGRTAHGVPLTGRLLQTCMGHGEPNEWRRLGSKCASESLVAARSALASATMPTSA